MLKHLLAAFGVSSLVQIGISHAESCYHKPDDLKETIIESPDGSKLIWLSGKKRIEFETGGAGTGLDYWIALDKKGEAFRYEYEDGNLVFGGVAYVPGCK